MNATEARRRLESADVNDVTCPHCEASPTEPCLGRGPERPHKARRRAFEEHRAELGRLAAWEASR